MAVSKMMVDVIEDTGGNLIAGLNIMSKAEFDAKCEANKAIYGSSGQAKENPSFGFKNFIIDNYTGYNHLFHTTHYNSKKPLNNALALPIDDAYHNLRNDYPISNPKLKFNIDGRIHRFVGMDIVRIAGSYTRNNNTSGIPFGNPRMPSIETNGGSLSKAYVKGDMISLFEAAPREVLPGATAAGNYADWLGSGITPALSVAAGALTGVSTHTVVGSWMGLRVNVNTFKTKNNILSFNHNIINSDVNYPSNIRLWHSKGAANISVPTGAGSTTVDVSEFEIYAIEIYTYIIVGSQTSITIDSFSLTQSGQCNIVALEDVPAGTNINARPGNVSKFAAIDSFSHTDFMLMESWVEDVSITGMVYPLGNVQYSYIDVDGCTGIAQGTFTGADTYSLYGNWETPGEVIGKGYIWANLTPAQQNSFAANSDNNIYATGGKVYQARYRTRTVEGLSNSWINLEYVNYQHSGSAVYSVNSNNYLRLQGNNTTVTDLGLNNGWICYLGNNVNNDIGAYGYGYSVQAIPIMTVQRRNPGIYDPSLNPQGCAMVLSGTSAKEWWEVNTLNAVSDCFNPANIAVVDTAAATPALAAISLTALATATITTQVYHQTGTIESGLSGRPDSMYVDEINVRDCHDRRIDARPVTDYLGTLDKHFNDLTTLANRGHQGEYVWKKFPKEVTITGVGVLTISTSYGMFKYGIRFPHTEKTTATIRTPNSSFRSRDFNGHIGKSIIVGDNGNSFISSGVLYLAHYDGYSYFEGGAVDSAAELARFNTLFPVGTKLSYYWADQTSSVYDETMPVCDIIGDPRNLQSRVKYTVTTGVAQVVNLEMDDVVLAANGTYYISLATRVAVDLSTDTMTVATNWVNMGANGTAGGYPSKWFNHGFAGIPLISDQNNHLVSLRRHRYRGAGGYTIPLNLHRANGGSYGSYKVLVTTNGITTELPLVPSWNNIGTLGTSIGYFSDYNQSALVFNLTGTGAYDPVIEANTIIQIFYQAQPALTKDVGTGRVLAIGDGFATGWYLGSHSDMVASILEKTPTILVSSKNNVRYRFKIDKYSTSNTTPYGLMSDNWGTDIIHAPIILGGGSGAFAKLLPHLVVDSQGMANIALTYKELKYDDATVNQDGTPTNTWGDDSMFDVPYVNGPVRDKDDLNGNRVVYGIKYIPLRRFVK